MTVSRSQKCVQLAEQNLTEPSRRRSVAAIAEAVMVAARVGVVMVAARVMGMMVAAMADDS